jgi:hypothetical protein
MATEGYSINIANTEAINENDELKVTIKMEEVKNSILGVQGTLEYDKDILEITEINTLKDSWMITFNEENGTFLLEISDDSFYDENEYIHDNEDFLEIKFKVKDGNKRVDLKISNIKVVDNEFNTIEIEDFSKTIKENNSFKIVVIIMIVIFLVIFMIIGRKIIKRKLNKK